MDKLFYVTLNKTNEIQTRFCKSYGHVLNGRDIQYSLFDENSAIIYSTGIKTPLIELSEEEWHNIKNGQTVTVKQDFKRFNEAVTFVLLPYVQNNQFVGGILLHRPLKAHVKSFRK